MLRDAPEPTGEEGEDTDMELPKVYEPVWDIHELQERLEMFLSQFNEMVRGAGMDLVFFPDAMLHLVKVNKYNLLLKYQEFYIIEYFNVFNFIRCLE